MLTLGMVAHACDVALGRQDHKFKVSLYIVRFCFVVRQAGLELTEPFASVSKVLGLKVCVTMPDTKMVIIFFKIVFKCMCI